MCKKLLKLGIKSTIVASTPVKFDEFIEISNKNNQAYQKVNNYQKKKIELLRKKIGIGISLKTSNELLNKDVKQAVKKFWDKYQETVSKDSLNKYIWSKSCENSDVANSSKKMYDMTHSF